MGQGLPSRPLLVHAVDRRPLAKASAHPLRRSGCSLSLHTPPRGAAQIVKEVLPGLDFVTMSQTPPSAGVDLPAMYPLYPIYGAVSSTIYPPAGVWAGVGAAVQPPATRPSACRT